MGNDLFLKKIRALEDSKLIDLLKLRNEGNKEILTLASAEAKRRGIEILEANEEPVSSGGGRISENNLDQWNWGAFFLAPFWAFANKLDKWALLTLLPGINIPVVFYLAMKGNRIAYKKTKLKSMDEFMIFQKHWSLWGVRIFWIYLAVVVIGFLFETWI